VLVLKAERQKLQLKQALATSLLGEKSLWQATRLKQHEGFAIQ
jgi:hypothetical protein